MATRLIACATSRSPAVESGSGPAVVAEWDFEDEKLAYLAPPGDDTFWIEVLEAATRSQQTSARTPGSATA